MWWNPYWYSSANIFFEDDNVDYYGLPNCTCYAWGRMLELGATNLTLCPYDAGSWWGYTQDGYQRGQTPRLGAIACWYSSSSQGGGHVAVVESITDSPTNGLSFVTSNSNLIRPDQVGGNKNIQSAVYNLSDYWYERTLYASNNFGFLDYVFQGFIYVLDFTPPEPASWISGNYRLSDSERDSNAIKFYYVMTRYGCSYNAILGMLANIQHESVVNPGAWEGYNTQQTGGYGLVQWTPHTKYSNWAGTGWEDNGDKECERIIYESQNNLQWGSNWYAPQVGYPQNPPETLAQFLVDTTTSPKVLADYWILYYERPDESGIAARMANHQYWVDYFDDLLKGGYTPPSPPVPPYTRTSNDFIYKISKRKFMKKRGLPWR